MTRLPLLALSALFALSGVTSVARADHGCSDERVSLPDGPGSIGGVGDNVQLDPNMGSMSTTVGIEVPSGFEGATPSLALDYSSSAGSGEVGYGWSLALPSIERMRMRGLPVYDESDEIVADGSTELIRTGTLEGSAVYRARFEGGFVRYRWYDSEGGAAGYWTAEQPDGSIAYYGADESGTPVRAARVETASGEVYRWHVVAVVDRFGHAIRYSYAKDGEYSLIDEIAYAHDAGGDPLYSVRFAYEDRPDAITTGEPGFLLALTKRLSEIRVVSGAESIRRYLLSYEDLATSGGASRLAAVEQHGRGGVASPIVFRYAYSRSLDGSCSGSCDMPFVVDMGSLPAGVDIRSGRATLIDMNGDALPDIVSTSPEGLHTIVPAQIDPDTGTPSFGAAYPSAATTGSTAFILNAPGVQVLDVDGDGFTDMIESRNGDVLCNDGSGDWNGSACLMDSTLPVLESDGTGDSDPRYVRFLDYDDDHRIDIIRTLPGTTEVFVNDGSQFVSTAVTDIGAQFDVSPTLTLADLNGDGLQDPIEILTGATQVRYRLNLGYGRWTDWTTTSLVGFGAGDLGLLQVEDINADGMADVALVAGNEVRYAVNRGDHFEDAITITSADVTGDLPERVADSTVVLFADMNGSGSRDIVWITGSRVQFLELFPTRPNLISRVENGLGSVQQIAYGSSVLQQARDAGTSDEWQERLPYPVNVVLDLDQWNRLTGMEGGGGLHDLTHMTYHDGFYDGVERAFRGFAHVESQVVSDLATDGEEAARSVMQFDVGKDDPYRAGRLLHQAAFAGSPGAWRPISETTITYADCPVADVPSSGLTRPIRFVCETRREETMQEGAPEAEWATTRVEMEHDGYGQVIREAHYGVVSMGSPSDPLSCGECTVGACGADCLGDEEVVETTYVEPGDATGGEWILGRAIRVLRHDGHGGPRAETVTTYDGPDFVGLPEGTLTRGAITSVKTRVSDDDEWIWTARLRRDAHGNVVEEILPRGAIDVLDDHRHALTFDADGLRMVREEELLHDGAARPIALRRELAYDPAFGEPVMETGWMLVSDGAVVTPRNARRVRYDGFGRPEAMFLPGDPDTAPSEEYTYELADPVSRIVVRSRSALGGALDTEEIQCFDGLGRRVQTRTRVAQDDYQVSRYVELNRRGHVVRAYQAYRSASADCDTSAPSVPYTQYTYDAEGRAATVSPPDDDEHGSRSVTRYEYGPLVTRTYDSEDNDDASAHASTPLTRRVDGLGRLVEVTRDLGEGQFGSTTLAYDGLGNLVSVIDPLGEAHEQAYDLAGRLVSVTDPSTGTMSFTRDAAGNVIERRDARGRRVASEHDALGRTLAHWDPDDEDATRTTFVYDFDASCAECENGAGRLVSTAFPMGELGLGRDEVGYDARGRMVFEARTLEGHRYVTEHEYDLVGRLLRTTLPGGIVLERGYDDAARPTSIEGVVDEIAYDEQGDIGAIVYANGARTERTYYASRRLRRLETSVGGVVLQGASYERDRVGNILAMHDTSDPSDQSPGVEATFAYDAWYRLTNAAFGAADETLELEYDLGDRVLRRESSLGAASRAHAGMLEYDDAHPDRVTRAGERAYGYDEAGHVTQRGTTELTWDHAGRLVSARAEGGRDGAFFYGAGTERVAKLEDGGATFYVGPEVEVRDGIVYAYPRAGLWRVARMRSAAIQTDVLSDVAPLAEPEGEINAADAWVAHAAEAGIVSEPASAPSDPMRLLRGAARRLLTLDGGDVTYLHHDHLGSITLATNADGERVGETLYYPNGAIRYERGFTDEHGFTSQERDSSSGLIAFQHRELDVDAGRWMSPDPAFTVLSANLVGEQLTDATSIYGYAGNHLMNAFDPNGLATVSAGQRVRQFGARAAAAGRAFAGRAAAAGRTLAGRATAAGRALAGHAATAGRALAGHAATAARALGSAAKSGALAAGGWARAHPVTAGVLGAGIIAAGLLSGGVGAGIAAGAAAAGLLLGRGVRAALRASRAADSRTVAENHVGLKKFGLFVLSLSALATGIGLVVGVIAVTGGGAAVAAALGGGVWGAAHAGATNALVEAGVGAADVIGTAAEEGAELGLNTMERTWNAATRGPRSP